MKKLLVVLTILIAFSTNIGYAEVPLREQIEIVPLQSMGVINVVAGEKDRTMTVNHEIRDGDVYIECLIHPFTFTKEKVGHAHKDGEGHIRLYINNKHVDSIFRPAFIIKGLPTGNHEIKIEVAKNDKTPYDLEETFTISIPEKPAANS
ncbi:hypothetical protein [Halalkalibacter urbisdiaboli]|uniref:hypothetical protein n=1 Tax=Halalkalibacter urbisdiaboli TaxID=1960589 RepID=UPI000B44DF02|nr:hypothetical protein [Halalkalibacter urbisdiaboli]